MWDNGKKIALLRRVIEILFFVRLVAVLVVILVLLAVLITSLVYMQICT